MTANRRLTLASNHGLSLPVRLRSRRRNETDLVGQGLRGFLLLPRGEAVGQTTEIVAVVRVFRIGFSRSPHVAILAPDLHRLRGGDQSEIVLGVLKIVLGGDRVVTRVCVACQLKVFSRHMLRRAPNSDVGAMQVVRSIQ